MMDESKLYDAVVIGGGPAGLTAAIYLARARYRVLVVEKDRFGGQITITENVVNYPGIPGISGVELGERMRRQAEGFGAEFLAAEVTGLSMEGDVKTVSTTRGDVGCFGVLLATGANPRLAGFEGEREFQGRGVAYCATCDGEFFTGKDVFVVGGGLAACEEALFLTKYASSVTIVVRRDEFRAERSVVEQVEAHDKIDVSFCTRIASVSGDTAVRRVVLEDTESGETFALDAEDGDNFGVFVFAGYAPATDLVAGLIELDPQGYVSVDESGETSLSGLFAAGDVCQKSLRQVTTAVGQAATVATAMERYLKRLQEKTGIVPEIPALAAAEKARREAAEAAAAEEAARIAAAAAESDVFDLPMLEAMHGILDGLEGSVVLALALDERPVSAELEALAGELARLNGGVEVVSIDDPGPDAPYLEVRAAAEEPLGIRFHGVPGGHEFESLLKTIRNVEGPALPAGEAELAAIAAIDRPVKLELLVTLTCTNCPDVAAAVQRIAAANPNVEVDIYDAGLFPSLVDEYHVMGVPFLIKNGGEATLIGRQSFADVVDFVAG